MLTKKELSQRLQKLNTNNDHAIDVTTLIKKSTMKDIVDSVQLTLPHVQSIDVSIELPDAGSSEEFYQMLDKYRTDSSLVKFTLTTINDFSYVIEALKQDKALLNLFQNIRYDLGSCTKEEIIGFINSLKDLNCTLKSIEVPFSGIDCIMLQAITGIQIRDFFTENDTNLSSLFANVYSLLLLQKSTGLDSKTTESSIKQACSMTLSSDGKPMPYTKALRLLKDFDWHFLNMDQVKSSITELRQQLPIKQDVYHIEAENGLHFYMVKVNDSNAQAWQDWARIEENASRSVGISKAQAKASTGIVGFLPSFRYYDNNDTETWVAFASNEKLSDPSLPSSHSIEMAVTMMTSGGPFSSHIGVFRPPSYKGEIHKGLAMRLHGFTAKATLEHHHDKEYMITVPESRMREILLEKIEAVGGFVFIGGDHTVYPTDTLEKVINTIEIMKNHGFYETDRVISDVYKQTLNLALIKQQALLQSGKIHCPFETIGTTPRECSSFVIKNDKDQVLCSLTEQDMHGEFAWFFDSPYLFRNADNAGMVTTKIEDLSRCIELSGQIEHIEY